MKTLEDPSAMSVVRLKRWLPYLGLVIAAVAIWVLIRRVREIEPALLFEHLVSYPSATILAAVGCVAAVMMVSGGYEILMLQRYGRPLGLWRPFLFANIANPIGQCIGLSTLTAGALRYRVYAPLGLSQRQIAAIAVLSALPFILGTGLLLDLCLVVGAQETARALRIGVIAAVMLGAIGLCKDFGYQLVTAVRRRPVHFGRVIFRLPSARFTLAQFAIGVVVVACIAGILYVFMPPELGMGFGGFLVVYSVGVIASRLSTVPAGLGVLEASMLLMLPDVPREKLLAAILMFRLVFQVAPLILALGLLALYELASHHGLAGRLWRTPAMPDGRIAGSGTSGTASES
jgi:phosphatidylglycerol lysyltransferase